MLFAVTFSVLCLVLEAKGQLSDLRFSKYLDLENKYELKWDFNDTHMDFQVTVQALGYVGFGFSKYGRMTPADMTIGWIIGDQVFLGDYHTEPGSRAPMIDKSADWLIQGGSEMGNYTTLRFYRKLDTCDPEDEPITSDTMQVIYSYHDVDPNVTSGLVHYHGDSRRGSIYINLMETMAEPVLNENITLYTIDFTNYKFPIPAMGSYRQCIVFNMTGLFSRSHVIKYEPIISPGNERSVYRLMLYRCNLTSPIQDGVRYECENEVPVAIKSCKNIVANWAMGGEAVNFPGDMGLPMGGDGEPSIYVLEIHYTNFELTADLEDSSGIRLTYTPTLRTYDAGMLNLGTVITNGWKKVIPQGEHRYISKAYCSPRCLNWGFSNTTTPIKIVGILFQGNDVAETIKLRHFRGAIELPWISKDSAFTNFFQNTRFLQKPVYVSKWDTLVLECEYNTTTRQGITLGGWSRVEELCRATLIYTPRKTFDMCLGWSSFDQLRNETGQLVPEGEAVAYLANMTTWDNQTKDRVKLAIETSTERSLCSSVRKVPSYAIDRYTKPKNQTPFTPNQEACRSIPLQIPPLL